LVVGVQIGSYRPIVVKPIKMYFMEQKRIVEELWRGYLHKADKRERDRIFREMVSLVTPKLVAIAIGRTKDEHKARDIVGDVFLKLLEHKDRERIENLDHYLCRAVKNACNNDWARFSVRQRHATATQQSDTDVTWSEYEHFEQEAAYLRHIKSLLTPKEYQIFDMLYVGYNTQECAAIIGLSKSRVDNLQSTIRKKIKGAMFIPTGKPARFFVRKSIRKVFNTLLVLILFGLF